LALSTDKAGLLSKGSITQHTVVIQRKDIREADRQELAKRGAAGIAAKRIWQRSPEMRNGQERAMKRIEQRAFNPLREKQCYNDPNDRFIIFAEVNSLLDPKIAHAVLDAALDNGADFAELFVELRYSTEISMLNGKVESAVSGTLCGTGVRVFSGTTSAYGHTNDLSIDSLSELAARLARSTGSSLSKRETKTPHRPDIKNRHMILLSPDAVEPSEKAAIMKLANEGARSVSDLVVQVLVSYIDSVQTVWIFNSDGLQIDDRRVRTRLTIRSVAEYEGTRETAHYSPGSGLGIEFYNTFDVREAAKRPSRMASKMVRSRHAPAGKMPVVISNGFGGVIFHEACGHALEATSVAKGASVFSGKLDQKVASECVSAMDDPTIPNAWGSANIDDEGKETRPNLLIERGILKSYMVDRLNGMKMSMESTSSARRQDYTYPPTSRMSNTFITAGNLLPEEIIAATEYGLYAKSLGGGSVTPSTGEYNFAVTEGYLIDKGRITESVRGATLIGKGHETLKKIDMVGCDLSREQGMCGSASGMIPADVGQPTIRVSELIVGGRS